MHAVDEWAAGTPTPEADRQLRLPWGLGDRSNEAKLEAGPVALHTGPGWLMIGERRTVVMP